MTDNAAKKVFFDILNKRRDHLNNITDSTYPSVSIFFILKRRANVLFVTSCIFLEKSYTLDAEKKLDLALKRNEMKQRYQKHPLWMKTRAGVEETRRSKPCLNISQEQARQAILYIIRHIQYQMKCCLQKHVLRII
jgi:hypothetical protein